LEEAPGRVVLRVAPVVLDSEEEDRSSELLEAVSLVVDHL
jgi:hypothetical protein